MKRIYLMVFFITVGLLANAQRRTIDSLRGVLSRPEADTEKIHTLILLCGSYYIPNPDSAIIFGQQAYDLAVKYNKKKQEIRAINNMANAYSSLGDYPKSMQFYYRAKSAYEEINDVTGITTENNNIGATYIQEADYKNGLAVLQLANRQWYAYIRSHKLVTIPQKQEQTNLDINIAECFLFSHRIDSAVHYLQLTIIDNRKIAYDGVLENIERDFGEVEIQRRDKAAALQHLRLAAIESVAAEDVEMLSMTYLSSAKLYHEFSERDSAEFYAKKAFEVAATSGYEQDVLNAGKLLYTYYDEDHNLPEAYKYFKLTTAAKDSLYSQDRLRQLLSLDFDEKQRRQDIAAAQEQYRDEVRTWLFIAGSIVLSLLVFVFWRSSLQRKSANQLLKTQKEDIESALSKLQSTQVQLIQSEKMASLGELTAGIAHEIQNPLNFVNNFSEVNSEMIDELKAELQIGNIEDALILADEIQQNEDKISHHGKRADAIVKGMLQHSRVNSNVKELTDINKVADEYLRLAYHGLRAKDKIFNAELETHFADNLPDINVVPQDIGRVLLNLFTNAFYATQQKQKLDLPGYKPTVSVATVAQSNEVVITVKDNGNGIPEGIKDKIMQPFFTTKPTGQGTGLGLSLSYDIIVKGHGGKIDVKSEEGAYTEFIIAIPV